MSVMLYLNPGSASQPRDFSAADRRTMALGWMKWGNNYNLEGHVEGVRSRLRTPGRSVPTVIYVHDSCGCDRTGEFFAAYAMRYQGYGFLRAMQVNELSVAKRHIAYAHQTAAQPVVDTTTLAYFFRRSR